jgi:hypothetical protein
MRLSHMHLQQEVPMNTTVKTTPATKATQIRLSKVSASYWRVTFDNPGAARLILPDEESSC